MPNGPGLRVLLVDDCRGLAGAFARPLRDAGHAVGVAPDGPAALRAADVWHPDVVILGIDSPGRDGYALALELHDRAAWRKPMVVALADHGDEEARRRSLAAGAHLHLPTPVNLEMLLGFLDRFGELLGAVEGFDPGI